MLSTLLVTATGSAATLVVGAAVLGLIRSRLRPNAPTMAALLSVILANGFILGSASVAGIDLLGTPTWLCAGAFLGLLWVQPDPLSTRAICRSMALVAGMVAVYASLSNNLAALTLSLGVAGLLLGLSEMHGAVSGRSSDGG